MLKPAKYIILEEPSGRERKEISEQIDLVVYIDTPQDSESRNTIKRVR